MFKFIKYMCVLSVVATPILFKQNIALAAGFTASCQNINVNIFTNREGFSPLTADCYTATGQLSSASIPNNFVDLNAYIVNDNGVLKWQEGGGFARSVRNCTVGKFFFNGITAMQCEAADGKGNWVKSAINLDEKIGNNNGQLTVSNVSTQGGSHPRAQECAKYQYTYLEKEKDGKRKTISGTTNPERCGESYREGHSPEAVENAKKSKKQACDAAWGDLPKLTQGDEWQQRKCNSFHRKLGG